MESPLLSFILAYIIRYIADPMSNIYIFRENENISIYIFIGLIVALFLGLMVSAEEIFHDRKILKREAFLNLSRSSYLISKVLILFALSAIQTLTFVFIGNTILGIKYMYFAYWLALFSTAAFANMLGLNVSASFNSVVTIYIIIPLLMIPMMVLSGAMFSFDKLNRTVSSVDKVPWIADLMPTKWGYEALMVHQFKDNDYEKYFYDLEKEISNANFKIVYYIPELTKRLDRVAVELNSKGKIINTKNDILLLKNEISLQNELVPAITFNNMKSLVPGKFNLETSIAVRNHLSALNDYYQKLYDVADKRKNNKLNYLNIHKPLIYKKFYDKYYNEHLADMVQKVFEKEKNKVLEYNHRLIQQIDPIYLDPRVSGYFDFRAHFYAPRKYFMGKYFDTFWFNISFIWFFTFMLYLMLHFDLLKKIIELPDKIRMYKK